MSETRMWIRWSDLGVERVLTLDCDRVGRHGLWGHTWRTRLDNPSTETMRLMHQLGKRVAVQIEGLDRFQTMITELHIQGGQLYNLVEFTMYEPPALQVSVAGVPVKPMSSPDFEVSVGMSSIAKEIEAHCAAVMKQYVGRPFSESLRESVVREVVEALTKNLSVRQVDSHAVQTFEVSVGDPLDEVIDEIPLRVLLERDRKLRTGEFNLRDSGMPHPAQHTPFTPAQRAAISAHWSADLRAKVEAKRKADAESQLPQVMLEGDPEDHPW